MELNIPEAVPKAEIKILGTSHIAKESQKRIKKEFETFQPDIIALELDQNRLYSLLQQEKGEKQKLPLSAAKQIGFTGYLFILIGRMVQKKLGNIVDVNPGIDMLTGVQLAQKNNKPFYLVDQDIQVTMQHLSKQFTFKEKMRMLGDVIFSPFQKKKYKKYKITLDKVPDKAVIDELMGLLKDRYPSLHHVLIIERNIVMARHLDHIVRRNPGKKVLLIIGAGHEDDLRHRLKHLERLATVT